MTADGADAATARDQLLDQRPEEIAERAATVGEERLDRSFFNILVTGVIAGLEVSLGALAAATVLGSLTHAAPRLGLYGGLAVAGLVFPVGFLFVILGRSELFTENFLIPVTSVVSGRRRPADLLWLWVASWLGNIAGCVCMAALLSVPDAIGTAVHSGFREYAAYKLSVPLTGTFISAVIAGLTMTVLTWLLVGVRSMTAKVVAIMAAGYVLFAVNLSHAIVGSAMIFAGFAAAHHSVGDVAAWVGVATAGNLAGGVVLVTGFRLVQAWEHGGRPSG